MASLNPPVCDFGWKAPDFRLLGVDGKYWTLAEARGPKGTLVLFICNHCPYVKAIRERLVADLRELKSLGVNSIAISSNDAVKYPDDSYENMQCVAAEFNFSFPYVFDETQEVAKAYDAVCTPDCRQAHGEHATVHAAQDEQLWLHFPSRSGESCVLVQAASEP